MLIFMDYLTKWVEAIPEARDVSHLAFEKELHPIQHS